MILNLRLNFRPNLEDIEIFRYRWDFQIPYFRSCVETFGGCPQVWFIKENQFNWLTEEYQWYWFTHLNKGDRNVEGDVKAWNAWSNGHAFITDANGTDTCKNFINGTNLDINPETGQEYPLPKIKRLVCGGNAFIGERFMYNNVPYVRPLFMDAEAPPNYNIYNEKYWWCFIHDATNITASNRVNPFRYDKTKYQGRLATDGQRNTVKYPFMGVGDDARIPLYRLDPWPHDYPPNPFYPEMPIMK